MSQDNQDQNHIADLQIGPTDRGMVRFIILENGRELALDFEPEEALEIIKEIEEAVKVAKRK